MGYNKRQFQKTNDKKVLHKVRKHWVVVSLAMLMALGGGAFATHASANADSTTANNGSNNGDLASRINQNMNQSKNTLVSASAQSNNNASASAQKASANNASAQSNGNQSANNQGSVNEQSIVKQASLLHQQILGNANQQRNLQVANQASNNNRQNNSGLGRVNTNAPKRMLGDTDSSDQNSVYTLQYVKSDGGLLTQQRESDATGTPFDRNLLNGWSKDFAGDHQYQFNPNEYHNGFEFDNSGDVPSTWIGGDHTLQIAVSQIPQQNGQIVVQYDNVSDSSHPAISSKVYSDQPGQVWSDLPEDEQNVPMGFSLDKDDYTNGIISSDGLDLSVPNDVKYVNGVKTIQLAVTPNASSANVENVVYEDVNDNNVQVGGTQITGKKNKQIDGNVLTHVTHYSPTGYNVVNNGMTPSDSTKFNPNATFVVPVEPNGVTAAKPSDEKGYSLATVNYVVESSDRQGNPNSDAGQVVYTKQFLGQNSDTFNPMSSSTSPYGYKINPDNYDNDNIPKAKYSTKPVDTIYVDPIKDSNHNIIKNKPKKNGTTYYVQYQDENNNNNVISTLTEKGTAGTPINYSTYTTLLPSNSTFAGLGTHDADVEPNATNVVLVKKAGNTGNINVSYIDKNTGSDIDNATIKGSDVNYGSDIDVDNYTDKSGQKQSMLPSGYTPVSGQNTMVHVNSDTQNLDVLVNGNVVSDTTPKGASAKNQAPTVTIVPVENYYDANGTHQQKKDNTDAKQISLSGVKYDSDNDTVNLDNYKPTSNLGSDAYITEKGQNNHIKVDKNGHAGDAQGKVYFNYDRVSPVIVNFINNRTGQKVDNSSYKVMPSVSAMANDGQANIDVTKGSDQTKPENTAIPKGYTAVANQNPVVTAQAQRPLTVNYMVQGNKVTVNYVVNRTTNQSDGAPATLSPVHKTATVRVGDQISMDPNDKTIKPAGYIPESRNITKATVEPGGTDGTGVIPNGGTTFKYDATPAISSVTPIEIEYINQSGTNVGHKEVTGPYGNQITADDPTKGGLAVPAHYHLTNPNENLTFEFNGDKTVKASDGKQSQLARVDVTGDQLPNGEVHYNIVSNKMSDGSVTGSQDYENIAYNGANGNPAQVGDQIHVNASDYNPSKDAYSPTYSDASSYFTVNSDGTVTPSNPTTDNNGNKALAMNYNIKQGYVTVTYKDGNSIIGTPETVNGDINKSFDMGSYEKNTPVVGNQHYVYTGVTNPATKYTSTHQNPVVSVEKWDTAHIQYKDASTGSIVGSTNYSNNPVSAPTIPSNYFSGSDVPSGYKLDGNYTGPTALNDATYTVNVKNNHSHAGKKADMSNLGKIIVHYVPAKYNTPSDVSNYNLMNDNTTDAITTYGNDGTGFNAGNYMQELNNAGATDVSENNNSAMNTTTYSKYTTGNVYIYYNAPSTPVANIKNTIRYLDENNGNQVVGTLPVFGTNGSKIDYSDYENVVPQGYTFDQLGNTHQNLTMPNANDDILVRKNVPDQTYGTILVTYSDGAGHSIGEANLQLGKTGASYNAAEAINSVPDGYQFDSIKGGIGNAPAYFPGAKDNFRDTVNVIVSKAPAAYTTYTVRYMNGTTPVATEKVTGKTGTLFNYSSYEDDIPAGYNYKSFMDNMPSRFDGNSRNVDVNITPAN